MIASAIAVTSVWISVPTLSMADIAFVRSDRLYVLKIDSNGRPQDKAPRLICRLWPRHRMRKEGGFTNPDRVGIAWMPDGKRILINHTVDTHNTKARMGVPEGVEVGGVSIVDANPGAVPKPVARGAFGVVSSDGRHLAYLKPTSGDLWDAVKNEIWVKDLVTGEDAMFAKEAHMPVWRPDGKAIAYASEETGEFSQPVIVMSFPEGKELYREPPNVNPCDISFSPDGTQLAIHYHLSRPLTGHTVVSLNSRPTWEMAQPAKYAPATLLDWNDFGRIVAWRTPDSENDGRWLKQELVFETRDSTQVVGIGRDASLSKDGNFVAYLTDHRAGMGWSQPADLVTQGLKYGGERRTLAQMVTAFALLH